MTKVKGFTMEKISGFFNKAAKGAALLIATEILIFTLVHANTGGMALMGAITPGINEVFDATGLTKAMYSLSEVFGGGPAKAAVEMGGNLLNAPGVGNVFIPTL